MCKKKKHRLYDSLVCTAVSVDPGRVKGKVVGWWWPPEQRQDVVSQWSADLPAGVYGSMLTAAAVTPVCLCSADHICTEAICSQHLYVQILDIWSHFWDSSSVITCLFMATSVAVHVPRTNLNHLLLPKIIPPLEGWNKQGNSVCSKAFLFICQLHFSSLTYFRISRLLKWKEPHFLFFLAQFRM